MVMNSESSTNAVNASSQSVEPIAPEIAQLQVVQTAPSVPDVSAFKLLEERLVIDRNKRKIGEVVVRKEIETRMVQVPIRSERLIVEQLSPEYRQLASVELGQGEVTGVDLAAVTVSEQTPAIHGEFTSIERAAQVLTELAKHLQGQFEQINLQIVLKDNSHREAYQNWLDRNVL